jgi:excisionase family DNA binding protein
MLTVEEVANRLKVTPRTVYRWIDEGKLKSLKIQGVVRITEEEYEKFIKG